MILFIFFLLLLISYFLYPYSLYFFKNKKYNEVQDESIKFDNICYIISLYNEEDCIYNTLKSILNNFVLNYNSSIYLGLDGCTDNTLYEIERFSKDFPNSKIVLKEYERQGKSNILNNIIFINSLNSERNLLIFMDANINIDKYCTSELLEMYNYSNIGAVGCIIKPISKEDNSEIKYIDKENKIKVLEGLKLGNVIGLFGACYSIKGNLFEKISDNIINDDFYISMKIISKKYNSLISKKSIVYENINDDIKDQFKRKIRFGSGNYQFLFNNLNLLNPFKNNFYVIYGYLFHKVIRWILPLLFPIVLFLLYIYKSFIIINFILFILFIYLILFLLFVYTNKKILFNFVYFITMNIALFIGFLIFLKGIKSNEWLRSKR